ncbi:MAG: methyltransferase domain-containing protein [Candidatus Promineifilaceae bacterium]|nr:methyltransferase domain-containing protein [Candidatus Promineifilaceae bacterium]
MSAGDIYNRINDMDGSVVEKIIQRLEFRDSDPLFTQWREQYLDKLPLIRATNILEVGCGTGVVTRAIANRPEVAGHIIGSDYSPALIAAAQDKAKDAGLDGRIDFRVGDIHNLAFEDGLFDIVIAHTVVSHISSPDKAIKELGRVVKPGGWIAIFDGDYASITFAYPDDQFAKQVEDAFVSMVANNPRIMRQLPHLLANGGLAIRDLDAYVLTEVGTSRFWMSAIETYTPMMAQSNLLPEDKLNSWLTWQRQASELNYFFGSCNYFVYLVRHPGN